MDLTTEQINQVYRECKAAIEERGQDAHVLFKMLRSPGTSIRLWKYGPKGEIIRELPKKKGLPQKALLVFHAIDVVEAIDDLRQVQARKEQKQTCST